MVAPMEASVAFNYRTAEQTLDSLHRRWSEVTIKEVREWAICNGKHREFTQLLTQLQKDEAPLAERPEHLWQRRLQFLESCTPLLPGHMDTIDIGLAKSRIQNVVTGLLGQIAGATFASEVNNDV